MFRPFTSTSICFTSKTSSERDFIMLLMFKGPQIPEFWSICLKMSFLPKGDSEPLTLPIIATKTPHLFITTWFFPSIWG